MKDEEDWGRVLNMTFEEFVKLPIRWKVFNDLWKLKNWNIFNFLINSRRKIKDVRIHEI